MEKDMSFYKHQPEPAELIFLQPTLESTLSPFASDYKLDSSQLPQHIHVFKEEKLPSNQSCPLQIFHIDEKAQEQKECH